MNHNRSKSVDLLLALAAVLISAISVYVATVANRVQEQLLAASTWPSLQFGSSNLSDTLEPEISLSLENAGVGPARVRWVSLRYRGEAVANQSQLLDRCCRIPDAKETTITITSSVQPVMKPEAELQLFRLRKSENPKRLWDAMNVERHHISAQVCYCSVLDDCWIFDSTLVGREAQPVDSCPSLAASDVWSG